MDWEAASGRPFAFEMVYAAPRVLSELRKIPVVSAIAALTALSCRCFEPSPITRHPGRIPALLSLGMRVPANLYQIGSFGDCEVKHQRHFDNVDNVVKQHLILGTDSQDAENQKDLWLSQNPAIRVVKIHGVTPEPETLLTRIGRKHVPRVSIMVEYEEPEVAAE
jgi:hypothetical protein